MCFWWKILSILIDFNKYPLLNYFNLNFHNRINLHIEWKECYNKKIHIEWREYYNKSNIIIKMERKNNKKM